MRRIRELFLVKSNVILLSRFFCERVQYGIIIVALLFHVSLLSFSLLVQGHESAQVRELSSKEEAHLSPYISVTDNEGQFHRSVELRGGAEFYWGELLVPSDFTDSAILLGGELVEIPKAWNAFESVRESTAEGYGGYGFGTYRFWLTCEGNELPLGSALYIPLVYSSYRLWIGGEYVGGEGRVSNTRYEAEASPHGVVYRVRSGVSGPVEVVIQVSNFHYPEGGLQHGLLFGDYDYLNRSVLRWLITSILVLGVSLGLLMFLLGIYFFHRRELWILLKFTYVLFLLLYVMASRSGVFLHWNLGLGWDGYFRLYYSMLLCLSVFLPLMFRWLYPQEFTSLRVFSLVGVGGLLLLGVVVFSPFYFGRLRWYIATYVLLSFALCTLWYLGDAIRAKQRDAVSYFWGTLWLGMFLVVPMIRFFLGYADLHPWGIIGVGVYLIFLFFLLVSRFSGEALTLEENFSSSSQILKKLREQKLQLEESLRGQQVLLDRMATEQKRSEWMDSGLHHLTSVIGQNRNSSQELCQSALDLLSKYLSCEVAGLYLARYVEEDGEMKLFLRASYGYSDEQKQAYAVLGSHEGVLGACFSDGTLQRLKNLDSEQVPNINSGLGMSVPPSLLLVPLVSAVGVVGVMVLGRIAKFEDFEVAFLNMVVPGFAHSILHTHAHETNVEHIKTLETACQTLQHQLDKYTE